MKNFSIEKFMGKWYEFGRTSDIFIESKTTKNLIDIYTENPDKKSFKTTTIYSDKEKITKFEAQNWPKNPKIENSGNFITSIGRIFFTKWLLKANFKILDTDYENYGIVICDSRILFRKRKWVWLLTRESKIGQEKKNEYMEKVKELTGLGEEKFIFMVHDKDLEFD